MQPDCVLLRCMKSYRCHSPMCEPAVLYQHGCSLDLRVCRWYKPQSLWCMASARPDLWLSV